MERRRFVTGILAAGAAAGFRLPMLDAADYRGRLFVFVQADGGWDPTSFCDPKTNTPGEPAINNWAESAEVGQAGNIRYAPFARNRAFFEKYYRRILVINGVDAQTNSHTAGVTHNWSGRISEGYPTTTALLAADNGADLAMPYLTFGGFSRTESLTSFTRLDNPERHLNIVAPEAAQNSNLPYLHEEDWATLRRYRAARIERLASAPNLLPRAAMNRQLYEAALLPKATEGLRLFAELVRLQGRLAEPDRDPNNRFWGRLRRQAQLAVLAFEAGVAVSADLILGGFDTHDNHDEDHGWLLENLTDSVDYLWDYAEVHGVADRLVVVMGSDFGRTNRYNADDGKDHWPIGSFLVMEKGQRWTNRVVGETDELHFARRVNPVTLRRDDAGGTLIHPAHVHKALRRYLGVERSLGSQRFPFRGIEDLRLFG